MSTMQPLSNADIIQIGQKPLIFLFKPRKVLQEGYKKKGDSERERVDIIL